MNVFNNHDNQKIAAIAVTISSYLQKFQIYIRVSNVVIVKIVLRKLWLTSASVLFPFIWRGFAIVSNYSVNVSLIVGNEIDKSQ